MEAELHKRVVGQDGAVAALARSVRRTRAGLKDPARPGGAFLFAGPSGVGKTELARSLAEFLFGDERSLIQLDMSEYLDRYSVSRLFGAPPGYVGYDEGGQLTEQVRRRPFSVVLFDEIDKAHPDVADTLMQILEEGRLTDGQGRVVDFRNTVIIMTTNLGTGQVATAGSLGFIPPDAEDEPGFHRRLQSTIHAELERRFRPEFLNRVDETIVFHRLSRGQVAEIVDLMIAEVAGRLSDRNIALDVRPAARALLAERGYDPVLGARPLRRTIQREIEDALSERILSGRLRPSPAGDQVVAVDVEGTGEAAELSFAGLPAGDPVRASPVGA